MFFGLKNESEKKKKNQASVLVVVEAKLVQHSLPDSYRGGDMASGKKRKSTRERLRRRREPERTAAGDERKKKAAGNQPSLAVPTPCFSLSLSLSRLQVLPAPPRMTQI